MTGKTGFVIQTKMAAAFNVAFEECKREGRNPGRIGHRLLTNNARGIGVRNAAPFLTKKKEDHPAVSAVKTN